MNIEEIKNRYLALYPSDDGVDMQNMIELEQSLNMKFPKDFFEISQFYSGGQLGDVSLYSFNINEVDNILEKTFLLRKTNKLPNKFIPDYAIGTFWFKFMGKSHSPMNHFRRFLVSAIFSLSVSPALSKYAPIAKVL